MTAAEIVRPFYEHVTELLPMYPPFKAGPDIAPGGPDAEAKYEGGFAVVSWRTDYPSAAGDPAWRALEIENTANHELGHPWQKFLEKFLAAMPRYWTFRGFPGDVGTAQAAADQQTGMAGWIASPRESFAECFGAAMAGRWTKPEKTLDYGRPVEPLAARAFFQELGALAVPIVAPPPAVPPPAPPPVGFQIVDIRAQLARAAWSIGTAPKFGLTYHHVGADRPSPDALLSFQVLARYHRDKNWAAAGEPVQRGDGIMYTYGIADGKCYLLRDPDAILWATDTTEGNLHYRQCLFLDDPPSPADFAAALELRRSLGFQFNAHRDWGTSACPGDVIAAWVHGEEPEMTPDELNRAIDARIAENPGIVNTTIAIKAALEGQNAAIVKLAQDETLDDAEVAALKARIDKLRTI